MRKKKRKTLPKDFEQLLETGDLALLQAVFETCEVDARGGYAKQTALAYDRCPDALARWLVARGADPGAVDSWSDPPLHTRARSRRSSVAVLLELGADVHASTRHGTALHCAAASRNAENGRLLLAQGARAEARDPEGLTPLEVALSSASNIDLERLPAFVMVMLDGGASLTPEMKGYVDKLGQVFEFHRESFESEPARAARAAAALDFLYATFDVTPAPRRRTHDGTAAIVVKATEWRAQHAELWSLLVPSAGPAQTLQGEVIRISGRLADEWERNGGANWDRDYARMAKALASYLQCSAPLERAEIAEIEVLAQTIGGSAGAGHDRLAELAVAWVLKNPQPISLEKPSYLR